MRKTKDLEHQECYRILHQVYWQVLNTCNSQKSPREIFSVVGVGWGKGTEVEETDLEKTRCGSNMERCVMTRKVIRQPFQPNGQDPIE